MISFRQGGIFATAPSFKKTREKRIQEIPDPKKLPVSDISKGGKNVKSVLARSEPGAELSLCPPIRLVPKEYIRTTPYEGGKKHPSHLSPVDGLFANRDFAGLKNLVTLS